MNNKHFFSASVITSAFAMALSSCTFATKPQAPSSAPEGESTAPISYSEGDEVAPATNVVPLTSLPTKSRNFYQLLVYSFADGNGDGIGDFKGIIDHLDYLEDLGVGGLWLSPIHEARSYHAYDVTDYYSVNHRYEVTVNNKKYTLDTLVSECHQRGIKVILDLVLNHSDSSCSWYSQHRDWYSGVDAFGGNMKDFNYDNQNLREEIKNVGKYWLREHNVDGFRLDAAKWIYNRGGVNGEADDDKNYAWWQEYYNACKTVNPNVYMIQEILTDQSGDIVNYYNTKMDGDFDFDAIPYIYEASRVGSISGYMNHLKRVTSGIRQINPAGIHSSTVSNHDIGRIQNYKKSLKVLSGSALAFAGLLNVLAPGDSYIYYGDELGMDGTCSGTREGYYEDLNYRTPMPFSSGRTNSENYLYSSVPGKTMTSSTYKNESPENSSFKNVYRKAMQAKNRAPALFQGEVEVKEVEDENIGLYVSKNGQSSASVLFNASSFAKKAVLKGVTSFLGEASLSGSCTLKGNVITMAPYSAAVFEGDVSVSDISGGIPATSATTATIATSTTQKEASKDEFGQEVTSEASGSLTIHCIAPESWGHVNCYAWVGQNQYLGAWPGSAMQKEGTQYTINIPHGASNIIFCSNGQQTVNLYRNKPGEYWFKIESGSGNSYTGDWYTGNPAI